jgi:hypothetical protein
MSKTVLNISRVKKYAELYRNIQRYRIKSRYDNTLNLAMKITESPSIRLAESFAGSETIRQMTKHLDTFNKLKGADAVIRPNDSLGNLLLHYEAIHSCKSG